MDALVDFVAEDDEVVVDADDSDIQEFFFVEDFPQRILPTKRIVSKGHKGRKGLLIVRVIQDLSPLEDVMRSFLVTGRLTSILVFEDMASSNSWISTVHSLPEVAAESASTGGCIGM